MQTFLIYSELCIFSVIILSQISAGADPQYEACLPTNCGRGPDISYPFSVPTVQESYCGYPGFFISCRNETPFLWLSGSEYVVEDIFYHNRSLRVYNAAVSTSNGSNCLTGIRSTTLPAERFRYYNVTYINLLFDCKNISEKLLRYEFSCGIYEERDNRTLALYERDEDLRDAIGGCHENIVEPVELYEGEGDDGVVDVAKVLRRGFLMNWIASDCRDCAESGGHCGFNETSFLFRCFCPDMPHSRMCKPRKDSNSLTLLSSLLLCF